MHLSCELAYVSSNKDTTHNPCYVAEFDSGVQFWKFLGKIRKRYANCSSAGNSLLYWVPKYCFAKACLLFNQMVFRVQFLAGSQ